MAVGGLSKALYVFGLSKNWFGNRISPHTHNPCATHQKISLFNNQNNPINLPKNDYYIKKNDISFPWQSKKKSKSETCSTIAKRRQSQKSKTQIAGREK